MRQNNPLLYIFVGITDDSLDHIREIQSKRVDVKGVGYINVQGEYEKNRLLADIRALQSRFLTTVYVTSGEIKVVYILNADSPQTRLLADIRRDTEEYLTYLYPGCVLSDIFLMLDDVHSLTEARHRGEVIDSLAKMRSDTCMLYMISNLNSYNLYEPNSHMNMLQGIALLGIMKDYVSSKSREQIYKWYNERYFQEDCYRIGGHFMTVGYLSISRPLKLIKNLMVIELLTCHERLPMRECAFVWEKHRITDDIRLLISENIYGLCMNAFINIDGLDNYTNEKALQVLFGDRLEQFYQMNYQPEHSSNGDIQVRDFLNNSLHEPSQGFYYVHAITAPDGFLRNYLVSLLEESEAEMESLHSQTENWRRQRCQLPKARWRNVNRLPDYIYDLAVKFLEPRFERLQPELNIKRLKEAIGYVDAYYLELDQKHKELLEFTRGRKEEADNLRVNDEIFIDGSNLNAYYIAKLHEFVNNDLEFAAIYSRLWHYLDHGALDLYAAELEDYIETLMRRDDFDRDIIKDLKDAWGVDSEEVYESIWQYIIKNRHFNIMLKGGYKNLHTEINVFLDASSQLAKWALSREKINFFYEENSDSIDVLYHGGAFSVNDLYYEALYRGRGL